MLLESLVCEFPDFSTTDKCFYCFGASSSNQWSINNVWILNCINRFVYSESIVLKEGCGDKYQSFQFYENLPH